MTKVTLGGDRLGSGKKMQVDLHGFERSTHDLSYIWRSTMSAGTLVPFLNEVALPGDTFDIKLNCDIKTHPTIGPLFGSYKVQLDVFQIPMRLYHSALHNNRLGIGLNMAQIKLPKMQIWGKPFPDDGANTLDMDNWQVHSSCILSYLGIRGIGSVGPGFNETGFWRLFNAIPLLSYWEIYKNYYANKSEEIGYVIHNTNPNFQETATTVSVGTDPLPGNILIENNIDLVVAWTGTQPDPRSIYYIFADGTSINMQDLSISDSIINVGTELYGTYNYDRWGTRVFVNWRYATQEEWGNTRPELVEFPLLYIDEMRDMILQEPWNSEFIVNTTTGDGPYEYITDSFDQGSVKMGFCTLNQEGLGIKTYQSDLFNNWLSTEWIDGTGGINEITAIDTSGGSFNIDTLQLSKKVYDMLNRIAVSGGSYNDWLNAVYDHEAYNRAESPVYCGGLIKELVFQEVVSNAASSAEGEQPLGTLAGKGVMGNKHKGGYVTIRTDEPSYIMGIISLTPRLDYSQGNKWDVYLNTLDDLHKPSLDQIGFQELVTNQMAWWTDKLNLTLQWESKSAGKQPAWINYMTNVNQVRGNFAIKDNEMFMTLNRRYEYEVISPAEYDIKDLTTYIDPSKFNHIFAQTSLDAQNFWTQISVDMIARRKMSAKIMPNL